MNSFFSDYDKEINNTAIVVILFSFFCCVLSYATLVAISAFCHGALDLDDFITDEETPLIAASNP